MPPLCPGAQFQTVPGPDLGSAESRRESVTAVLGTARPSAGCREGTELHPVLESSLQPVPLE